MPEPTAVFVNCEPPPGQPELAGQPIGDVLTTALIDLFADMHRVRLDACLAIYARLAHGAQCRCNPSVERVREASRLLKERTAPGGIFGKADDEWPAIVDLCRDVGKRIAEFEDRCWRELALLEIAQATAAKTPSLWDDMLRGY